MEIQIIFVSLQYGFLFHSDEQKECWINVSKQKNAVDQT